MKTHAAINSKQLMICTWNFQGSFLLWKGLLSPNFGKIWDGHHGRPRGHEMRWHLKTQLELNENETRIG